MKNFKYLFLVFSLPFISLFADESKPSPPPPPQEQELFNKDVETFIVNGEFLYWTIHEGALDYAIKMRRPAWGPTPSFAQGNFEKANFDWDPGFRVSAGYFRAENFWEALGEWTRIHVDGDDSISRSKTSGHFLTGTFPHVFTNPVERATSHIHLHYNQFNLMANRVFHPENNPHVRIRLSASITGAWIKQRWNVRYFDAFDNVTTTSNRWRYWGAGPRAGIGFDWFWGFDIYITGKYSTALLMGRYHNTAKEKTTATPQVGDDPSMPVRDARYKDYRLAFTNQFYLGPSYQKSFSKRRLEIFAGYELTFWSNLHEIFRSTQDSPQNAKETWLNNGLIAMHGLTVRASLNF